MHYLINHLPTAWALTVIHLRLSLVPVLAGVAIALPWGVLAWRTHGAATADHGRR